MAKKQTPNNPTFTVQQSILNKALAICGKALSDNKILPINEMFLFVIGKNSLDISACDMKSIISTSIEIQSAIDFRICIPGRKLQDYIAKSANEILIFEIETHIEPEVTSINALTQTEYVSVPERISFSTWVKSGSNKDNKAKFNCELDNDTFPRISNDDPKPFQLPASDFLELLNKTMFAISEDQLRPSATGLNIRIQPGNITGTALDFNMVATYTYQSVLDFEADFIIPKKALQQIQSLSPTGMLDMSISKSAISINWGQIRTTSLLIDERYPDYLSITPVENSIHFSVRKMALITSLKRVLPFSDIIKMVKLKISATSLSLIAENPDYSEEASETIPGTLFGGDITIGANGEYLLSILNSIAEDVVWFSFDSPRTAMIITVNRHVNPGKENLVLLMPQSIVVV